MRSGDCWGEGVGEVYELVPRREQTVLIVLPLHSVSSKEREVGKEATEGGVHSGRWTDWLGIGRAATHHEGHQLLL